MFAENIRDGFKFDPIEVQAVLARPGFYRLLDGTHRWSAGKSTGIEEVEVVIKDRDGKDPLLYAAILFLDSIFSILSTFHLIV